MRRTIDRPFDRASAAVMAGAAVALLLAGCVAVDQESASAEPAPPALSSYVEPVQLTDTNPDPSIVEVELVATVGTVEYLAGRPTEIWGYRDGAVPGSRPTVPGPMLRAKTGSHIIVHFRNELPRATTVHFHGPRIPHDADGSHVSQHALVPGETYDYHFVAVDAGSFWYHPHVEGYQQIERGLYGPMVLDGGVAPDVSADRYLVLDDVKLEATGALSQELSELDRMFGRQGNVLLVNGRPAPAGLRVAAGGRERWRIVNAANGRYFNLRIPGLRFLVIGTDGGLLPAPYSAETLLVVPGERYEVLVTFDGSPGTRRRLETVDYDRGHGVAGAGPLPLLQIDYGIRGEAAPAPLPATWRDLPPLPTQPETRVRKLDLGHMTAPGGALFFTINGDFWPGNEPIEVRQGDVEVWEMRNTSAMDHPVHMHGMFFEVLGAKTGWKDTVNVPKSSTVRFAVRFDPAGTWMLHCHILEHVAAGMLVDIIVKP